VADLSSATNAPSAVVGLNLGPGLYTSLVVDQRHLGALVFGRVRGAPQFGPHDLVFGEVFANAAAAAIGLGEVRTELETLGIDAEDERIARDLHDTVVQQLFAVGLSLQAMRATTSGPVVKRIDIAVADLDNVIGDIRKTIFRLPGRTASASGFRDQMLRLADRYSKELGFTPRIAFHGPIDVFLPDTTRNDLVMVLSEALSNVARHAEASVVEAVVVVEDGWLSLSVLDDGIGIADGPSAGEGLRNMSTRARTLGGRCTVSRRQPTGTLVEWRVPA
jgi:signal transduction histidine kinase